MSSPRLIHCRCLSAIAAGWLALFALPSHGDDWPQWNGPTRDGQLTEENIVDRIPADGLPRLWQQPVALGYSGPAVANGRVFVTDYELQSGTIANNPGGRDKLTGNERVLCLDARTGDEIWRHVYERPYAVSYGSGPRVTPTVHDGLVYTLGAEGNLICFAADDGRVIWQHDFASDYQAKTPLWGHSAAPLVYGDSLICLVGGEGSLVVSFDRQTGQEKWRSLSARGTGYCPPAIVEAGGTQQLIIWDPALVHSLNPDSGEEYWQHPLKPGYGMSILPPVVEGNLMFLSGESDVSAMFRLAADGPQADVVWRGKARTSVQLATAGAIFEAGYLYGSDTRSGTLMCVRAIDGQRMWQTTAPTSGGERRRGPGHGSAFLIRSRTGFLILSDTGDFISANLTAEGYQETGRFHAIDPTEDMKRRKVIWTYPAISDGRLFVRSGEELVCYDIRKSAR